MNPLNIKKKSLRAMKAIKKSFIIVGRWKRGWNSFRIIAKVQIYNESCESQGSNSTGSPSWVQSRTDERKAQGRRSSADRGGGARQEIGDELNLCKIIETIKLSVWRKRAWRIRRWTHMPRPGLFPEESLVYFWVVASGWRCRSRHPDHIALSKQNNTETYPEMFA